MNPFNNPQIHSDDLSLVSDLVFEPLENSYRSVLYIGNTIFFAIMGIIAISIYFSVKDDLPFFLQVAAMILFFTLLVFSFLSIHFGFKNKAYALRKQDIIFQTGWLWKSKTVVPFKRIQHSEVSQGPIDRMFNLGKLRVFTAGGSGSDLTIPGLSFIKANQLKDFIISEITTHTVSYEEE